MANVLLGLIILIELIALGLATLNYRNILAIEREMKRWQGYRVGK